MNVIIMRGITGSGKSQHIAANYPHAYVVSADHWFTENRRKWNPGFDLRTAHDQCYARFCKALDEKRPLVVVDNTNVRHIDYGDYLEEALDAGYQVTFVHVMCDPDVARERSKHARNMDKMPEENVRIGQWRQHQRVSEVPRAVDNVRVFSQEVWTSDRPEEDFKPPPKRSKRRPEPEVLIVRRPYHDAHDQG